MVAVELCVAAANAFGFEERIVDLAFLQVGHRLGLWYGWLLRDMERRGIAVRISGIILVRIAPIPTLLEWKTGSAEDGRRSRNIGPVKQGDGCGIVSCVVVKASTTKSHDGHLRLFFSCSAINKIASPILPSLLIDCGCRGASDVNAGKKLTKAQPTHKKLDLTRANSHFQHFEKKKKKKKNHHVRRLLLVVRVRVTVPSECCPFVDRRLAAFP